jgi:hypothetical protein
MLTLLPGQDLDMMALDPLQDFSMFMNIMGLDLNQNMIVPPELEQHYAPTAPVQQDRYGSRSHIGVDALERRGIRPNDLPGEVPAINMR